MVRAAPAVFWALSSAHAFVPPWPSRARPAPSGPPCRRGQQLPAEPPRELYVKSLDEELDEVDDLSMDRPYSMGATEAKKVKMFGVWLDEDVAGRKAGANAPGQRFSNPALTPEEEAAEEAAMFFAEGVQAFQKGDYAAAALILSKAVERADESDGPRSRFLTAGTPGMATRKGGEYALWQAQALHAQGDAAKAPALRAAAYALLKALKLHSDRAVGRVAGELLYIYEAPRIELDEGSFLRIPDLSKLDAYNKKQQKKGLQGNGGGYATIEPGPKKYSIEWLQEWKEKRSDGPAPVDPVLPLVATALCLGSLAFFAS